MLLKKTNVFQIISSLMVGVCVYACGNYGMESDEKHKENNRQTVRMIFPNSPTYSDSVDARLAYGIGVRLSPGGHYILTFEQDSLSEIPQLYFENFDCCENGCEGRRDSVFVQYEFSCNVSRPIGATMKLKNKDARNPVQGIRHVKLDGIGEYSGGISLNVIFTGGLDSTQDGILIDSLPRKIGAAVQEILDVEVDSVYVSYAWEHPTQGHLFSRENIYRANSLMEYRVLTETWNDVERDRAFGILLVNDFEDSHLGATTTFFGPLKNEKCLAGVSMRFPSGSRMTSLGVTTTAVHELGHYLGLRHTTLSLNDLLTTNDFSVFEDGIEDTDYCSKILDENRKSLDSIQHEGLTLDMMDGFQRLEGSWGTGILYDCPDSYNIMFHQIGGWKSTKGQQDIVQKNLTLIPH